MEIKLKKNKRINVRIVAGDRHIIPGCPIRVTDFSAAFVNGVDADGFHRIFRRADFTFEDLKNDKIDV